MLFKAISFNETGVKGINISIYLNNKLLRKIVTNNKGFSILNLTFTPLNQSIYNSIFKAIVLNIISNSFRLYGIRKFYTTEKQPITIKVKKQYFILLLSEHGTAIILQTKNSSGWFNQGSGIMFSATPIVMIDAYSRYSFIGWSGDINSNSSKVEIVVNKPIQASAEYVRQYFVSVSSKYGTAIILQTENRR